MKVQLAFRDTGHLQNSLNMVIAVGLIEFPKHVPLPEGMIGNFICTMTEDEKEMLRPDRLTNCNAFRLPIDKWGFGLEEGAATTDALTQSIWHAAAHRDVAQFFLRETRVEPSRPGLAVMAFAGLVSVNPGSRVDQDSLFQCGWDRGEFIYEGRVGQDIQPEWEAPCFFKRMEGASMSDFLRYPAWGFGEEPISLPWTMPLAHADAHDRYMDLTLMSERSLEQEQELELLKPGSRARGLDNLDRDPRYCQYLETLSLRGFRLPAAQPRTRKQEIEFKRARREIIESIMAPPSEAPRM